MNNQEPLITKDHFVACINTLKEVEEMAGRIYGVVHEYHRDDWLPSYKFSDSDIETKLIETLELALGDTEHWIDWFCYENNFGEGNGYWWDEEGNERFIKTPEELYDFITKDK